MTKADTATGHDWVIISRDFCAKSLFFCRLFSIFKDPKLLVTYVYKAVCFLPKLEIPNFYELYTSNIHLRMRNHRRWLFCNILFGSVRLLKLLSKTFILILSYYQFKSCT